MNILLINTNPVVSRLISLCTRAEDTVLEEVTDVSAVKLDSYDMVFVDDASYVAEVRQLLQNLSFSKKVSLLGKETDETLFEDFDDLIKKPFLPSQVTAVIESLSVSEEEVQESEEKHFIFPLSTEVESAEEEETLDELEIAEKSKMILDSNEIERIKALLDDEDELESLVLEDEKDLETRKVEVITEHLEADGLEIVSEDEIIDILSNNSDSEKPKKEKKQKKMKKEKKKSKKNKKAEEETYTFEETLIAALEGMKPKKIKKLLKGAEVTIKINFKDEK
jgi:hypothetical protein